EAGPGRTRRAEQRRVSLPRENPQPRPRRSRALPRTGRRRPPRKNPTPEDPPHRRGQRRRHERTRAVDGGRAALVLAALPLENGERRSYGRAYALMSAPAVEKCVKETRYSLPLTMYGVIRGTVGTGAPLTSTGICHIRAPFDVS